MSIIQNIIPSNITLLDHLQTIQRSTQPVLKMLTNYRNCFASQKTESQQLYAASNKILRMLQQEIQSELKRCEINLKKDKQSRPKTSKAVGKDTLNLALTKQTNTNQSQVNTREYLVKPTAFNLQKLNIYVCFLCFRLKDSKLNCIWENENLYLNHLQRHHNLEPKFELLLYSSFQRLPFSHVYYRDNLVNIFGKRTPFQRLMKCLHYINEQEYDKVILCECLSDFGGDAPIYDLPIYCKCNEFSKHIAEKHDCVCPIKSSHLAYYRESSKTNRVILNKEVNLRKDMPRIRLLIQRAIQEESNCSILQFLVESNPLLRLQCISQMDVNWRDVFHTLPQSANQQPTLIQLKNYLNQHQQTSKNKVQVNGLSEQQAALLNLQISLLDSSVYICGQCMQIIGKDKQEYIAHVYRQHTSNHRYNSHYLKFLQTQS